MLVGEAVRPSPRVTNSAVLGRIREQKSLKVSIREGLKKGVNLKWMSTDSTISSTGGYTNLVFLVAELYAHEGQVVELHLKNGDIIKAGIRNQTNTGVRYIPEHYLEQLRPGSDSDLVNAIHQGKYDAHVELTQIARIQPSMTSI